MSDPHIRRKEILHHQKALLKPIKSLAKANQKYLQVKIRKIGAPEYYFENTLLISLWCSLP